MLHHLEIIKPQVITTLPRRTLQKYVIWLKNAWDAHPILKNRLGELITSLGCARSHSLCSKNVHFTLTPLSFNFAAANFPCIPSLTASKPHLISFIFLVHKYIYKGGEGKGNDPDSDSQKLCADFKKDFKGNTIQKSTENEIYEKHVCEN